MKEFIFMVLIFVASIQCSAIKSEQSHHVHHSKEKDNHHMGFVGSRGKRSISILDPSLMETSDNTNANEEDGEWPTQNFYDQEGGVRSDPLERSVRAPKGFFYGMRGKKDFTNAEKRALMNLNGLRSRTRFIEAQPPRIDENLIEQQQSINSNQGYIGVREGEGKQYVSGGEKRAPKGFMGMRGKKRDQEFNDDDDFGSQFYPEKRIPSGFTGVRGKKDYAMLQ